MGGASIGRDHQFLSRTPRLHREHGLWMLLKEIRLRLTQRPRFEQHQVGFRWRKILLARIGSFAGSEQHDEATNESHPKSWMSQTGGCCHHGVNQNTEMERGLPRLEHDNARFLGESGRVIQKMREPIVGLTTLAIQHGIFAGIAEKIRHVTRE
jgi:hypothetical protein